MRSPIVSRSPRTLRGVITGLWQKLRRGDSLEGRIVDDRLLVEGRPAHGNARLFRGVCPKDRFVVPEWLIKVYRKAKNGDPIHRDMPKIELEANVRLFPRMLHQLEVLITFHEDDDFLVLCFHARRECESLEQVLAQRLPLPVSHALSMLEHLARGVSAVHSCGIVHRNINPLSVFARLDNRGDLASEPALLTDFSYASFPKGDFVSRQNEPLVSDSRAAVSAYWSPEQRCGAAESTASDMYALGRLAYDLLLPRRVSDGFFARTPPSLSDLVHGVVPEFADIASRCLAEDPGARPSAREFAGWAESAGLVADGFAFESPSEREEWRRRFWT